MAQPDQGQAETSEAEEPIFIELHHLPAKVALAIDAWIGMVRTKGGYGEIWIEIAGGEVKRIKPTESWLASSL